MTTAVDELTSVARTLPEAQVNSLLATALRLAGQHSVNDESVTLPAFFNSYAGTPDLGSNTERYLNDWGFGESR